MKQFAITLFFGIFFYAGVSAQKKALDHSVYDNWQRVGDRLVSQDGNWVSYVIEVQEGDPTLVIRSLTSEQEIIYPRGAAPQLSATGRFLVFRIKPSYTSIREARIKKKKPEDFPKDSLCIFELGVGERKRIPQVRSFKMPTAIEGLLAIHLETTDKDKRILNQHLRCY